MSRSFIVFGVELPWIRPLATALAEESPTVGISIQPTLLSLGRRGVRSPDEQDGARYETWRYPPGYNGRFRGLFKRGIQRRLQEVRGGLSSVGGTHPTILAHTPSMAPYVDGFEPERVVYRNYDDQRVVDETGGLGWTRDELNLVERSGTVICSSIVQTERFKEAFPHRAESVHHLAHGVDRGFLNPDISGEPEAATVCAVGYLSVRYDWPLILTVVRALPAVRFQFVGDTVATPDPSGSRAWMDDMAAVLRAPNVEHVPGLDHGDTRRYYWRSAANWMPYRVDLEFVRASCPLKLGDGLASGRPVVSADIPESGLHAPWVKVYESPDEAIALVREAVHRSCGDGARAMMRRQLDYAAANDWRHRAAALRDILGDRP